MNKMKYFYRKIIGKLTFITDSIFFKFYKKCFIFRFSYPQKIYWTKMALNIDKEWGTMKHDYAILEKILLFIKPKYILDFGCGSGRLFPLYQEKRIEEVVGQDISKKALAIAKIRYQLNSTPPPIFTLTNKDIFKLPTNHFDLIISNRVLQHIFPNKIEKVINKLTKLSDKIYINEMSDSDYSNKTFYLFKHNYEKLFNQYGFDLIQKGKIENQTWCLFSRKSFYKNER